MTDTFYCLINAVKKMAQFEKYVLFHYPFNKSEACHKCISKESPVSFLPGSCSVVVKDKAFIVNWLCIQKRKMRFYNFLIV